MYLLQASKRLAPTKHPPATAVIYQILEYHGYLLKSFAFIATETYTAGFNILK